MRLTALWWWIDRWRKSTAYTDMTLEEQGAYRNLLDEATLRGGPLPNDDRILAKACGDAHAWQRVRAVVMSRFALHEDGWHNETLDDVNRKSLSIKAERSHAGAKGNEVRWQQYRNGIAKPIANLSQTASQTPSLPSPSPSPSPSPDQNQNKNLRTVAAKNGSNGHESLNGKLLIKFVHEVFDKEQSYGDIKEAVKLLCKKRKVHCTGEAIGAAIDSVNALNVKASLKRRRRQ